MELFAQVVPEGHVAVLMHWDFWFLAGSVFVCCMSFFVAIVAMDQGARVKSHKERRWWILVSSGCACISMCLQFLLTNSVTLKDSEFSHPVQFNVLFLMIVAFFSYLSAVVCMGLIIPAMALAIKRGSPAGSFSASVLVSIAGASSMSIMGLMYQKSLSIPNVERIVHWPSLALSMLIGMVVMLISTHLVLRATTVVRQLFTGFVVVIGITMTYTQVMYSLHYSRVVSMATAAIEQGASREAIMGGFGFANFLY
jgi:hypothetical protein